MIRILATILPPLLVLTACTHKKVEVRIPSVIPKKTDVSTLSFEEKGYLLEYKHRRTLFDKYLKANKIEIYTCPGCGYPTLDARGEHEICIVCGWEDTSQDDPYESENFGRPNKKSLIENRIAVGKTLHTAAIRAGKFPNENVKDVIEILGRHKFRIKEIENEIPTNADTSLAVRKEMKKEKRNLIDELMKK